MITDRPSPVIDALDPIGLEELVGSAELLSRVDRKYLVPPGEVGEIVSAVGPNARVLEIAGRRRFAYRSLYFDTSGRDSYLSTARARRRRFKIRTRSYLDSDLHVLEVKIRGARGMTIKHRLPYAGDGLGLDAEDCLQVGELLDGLGVRVDRNDLRPSLLTRYERTTILLPAAGVRMTVDSGLVWSAADASWVSASIDRAVIETKSPRGCSYADRALWALRHRPTSISKFGTGLATLNPQLPSNRWHRCSDALSPLLVLARPTSTSTGELR